MSKSFEGERMRGERARELKVLHEREIIRTYAYLAKSSLLLVEVKSESDE